jgi:hypothetical protein
VKQEEHFNKDIKNIFRQLETIMAIPDIPTIY